MYVCVIVPPPRPHLGEEAHDLQLFSKGGWVCTGGRSTTWRRHMITMQTSCVESNVCRSECRCGWLLISLCWRDAGDPSWVNPAFSPRRRGEAPAPAPHACLLKCARTFETKMCKKLQSHSHAGFLRRRSVDVRLQICQITKRNCSSPVCDGSQTTEPPVTYLRSLTAGQTYIRAL